MRLTTTPMLSLPDSPLVHRGPHLSATDRIVRSIGRGPLWTMTVFREKPAPQSGSTEGGTCTGWFGPPASLTQLRQRTIPALARPFRLITLEKREGIAPKPRPCRHFAHRPHQPGVVRQLRS